MSTNARKSGSQEKKRAAVEVALSQFDSLPDLALVRIGVVAALRGVSEATVWRRVREGAWPAPVAIGPNSTGWRVGDLRKSMGA